MLKKNGVYIDEDEAPHKALREALTTWHEWTEAEVDEYLDLGGKLDSPKLRR